MTAAVCTAPDSNWALVERAQAGDRDAFAEIYRRYRPQIGGFIYKLTRNVQATDDLTADVFLRALDKIDRIEWQGKDLSAWLHTVARNRVADYRKSHAQSHTIVVANPNADKADDDPAVAPETVTLDHLTRADLIDALKALPSDYRQVIVLRYLNDLTLDETAQAMGRSKPAIKMLQHRALVAMSRDEHVAALAGAA